MQALECFDGVQTTLDLRSELVRITGELQVGELEQHLFDSLNSAGFLDNDFYRELKAKREAEFAQETVREAAFAGSAYPSGRLLLRDVLTSRLGSAQGGNGTVAIAAPHASPDGAWDTYRAAYQSLPRFDNGQDRTFVILGTSHYGAPDHFGLTRKTFTTPLGDATPDTALIDELAEAAPGAVRMEDYCHSVEHSIEFQVLFLQHVYGPSVRILPILCGPFVKSVYEGGMPEENSHVAAFFDALGNIFAREGGRLFTVLGIDMAHMGQRYGDPIRARAKVGEMIAIEDRDRKRIEQIEAGDLRAYWSMVQDGHDDLKWCGSAPLYTFLKTRPEVRGKLLHYHQWQIDPGSVVSFGAMQFCDGH